MHISGVTGATGGTGLTGPQASAGIASAPPEGATVAAGLTVTSPEAKMAAPVHDKDMARDFLAGLDPSAGRFTFQFFGDGPGTYAKIFHGTLDEVWAKVHALNTPARRVGVFVTINETDFKRRGPRT
jgi:hypothetical protein